MSIYLYMLITTTNNSVGKLFSTKIEIRKFNFSYFHRKNERTYYVTAPKKLTQVNHHLSIRLSVISTDRDKRMYIKILERSVRSGRSIQHERNRSFV